MIIITYLLLSIHATNDYEPTSRVMSYVSLPIPWDQSAQPLVAERYPLNDRGLDLCSDPPPRGIEHHVVSTREDQWGGMVGTSSRLKVNWRSNQPVALGADDDDWSADVLRVQRRHHVHQGSHRLGLQPSVAPIHDVGGS